MTLRRLLPLLVLAAYLPLAACGSSSQSVASSERVHPDWLVGTWQTVGWQIGADSDQFQRNVTVTFAKDGTWKSSGGGSGSSWLSGDDVVFEGVTSSGENFRSVLKQRKTTNPRELEGMVSARAGATTLSLKKLP